MVRKRLTRLWTDLYPLAVSFTPSQMLSFSDISSPFLLRSMYFWYGTRLRATMRPLLTGVSAKLSPLAAADPLPVALPGAPVPLSVRSDWATIWMVFVWASSISLLCSAESNPSSIWVLDQIRSFAIVGPHLPEFPHGKLSSWLYTTIACCTLLYAVRAFYAAWKCTEMVQCDAILYVLSF